MTTQLTATEDTRAGRDATEIAAGWLKALDQALARRDFVAVEAMLVQDAWWRDLLALTWDIRTFRRTGPIVSMLEEFVPVAEPSGFDVEVNTSPAFSELIGRQVAELVLEGLQRHHGLRHGAMTTGAADVGKVFPDEFAGVA